MIPKKKSWLFTKLALAVGGAGYAVYTYKNFQDALAKQSVYDISPYKLALYRTIPLSCMTAVAGKIASWQVPVMFRKPFYGAFAWMYECDLNESLPLETYPTFNDFFTRRLHNGLRPISDATLVSPADGKIIALGKLGEGDFYPEQVKGVRYPLKQLLKSQYEEFIRKRSSGRELYYCSVYLAPGSYHRFHSPVEKFAVRSIEHIPGEVLPVAPWVMRLIPGLVSLNERAVIGGSWKYGQMYMVPVGATNVRSISLRWPKYQKVISERLPKGQEIGQFEMGSLVILVFEGPKDFSWLVEPGSWVKYGVALGDSRKSSWWPF
jgi:phosphatidylserine decarboxylase